MEEKELIIKIKELRRIKPDQNWVVLTKNQIIGQEPCHRQLLIFNFLMLRTTYAGLILIFVLFGLFAFAQNSLPGDFLYPLKKIAEKSQAVFVSKEELQKIQLELANERVEELNKIAQTNQVRKLTPAIKEVQTSISQVTKNLAKSEKVNKKTFDKIVNLKQKLEKTETVLGAKIDSQNNGKVTESLEKNLVEMLIKDLENSILTEKQKELLIQLKKLAEEEKYSEALELYLVNQ